MNSNKSLDQQSDNYLKNILSQIGRNGEPQSGSAAAIRQQEISNILAERKKNGVQFIEGVMHHPV